MPSQSPAPELPASPETMTLTEARDAIRTGALTSEELVTACLRRIAETEPALHACVTVMSDTALAQAREADAAIQAKARVGPLHGLPIALKDLIETRGVLTTAGSRVLDDWIPDRDAAVVTRLAQAGAIALARPIRMSSHSAPTLRQRATPGIRRASPAAAVVARRRRWR